MTLEPYLFFNGRCEEAMDFYQHAIGAEVTDGNSDMAPSFKGFSLTLGVDGTAEAHRKFDALAQGGKVVMPLGPTFWSPCFGMLEDQFGVGWMVIVLPTEGQQ